MQKQESDHSLDLIKPVARASLSDKIVEQILDLISRNVLKPGERLPSERDLCKRFGVGRSSLREALRSLAVMGILEGRVGEGTYVSADNGKYLEKAWQWGLLLDTQKVQDLLETRLMLEAQTAFWAAQRVSAEELQGIEARLSGMAAAINQPEAYLEHDVSFHLLIAQATHNSMLNSLLTMTRGYLQEWIKRSLADPAQGANDERARISLKEHGRIVAALRQGNAEQAREAMEAHILSSSLDLQAHMAQA
jgi:GntR family transcriptional repressor for pyruvate dehydrogenase complex